MKSRVYGDGFRGVFLTVGFGLSEGTWRMVAVLAPNPDHAGDLNPSEIWAQKKGRSSLI